MPINREGKDPGLKTRSEIPTVRAASKPQDLGGGEGKMVGKAAMTRKRKQNRTIYSE